MQYRNFNSIDLTVHRGWDQYLSKAPVAQFPVAVMPTVPAVVAIVSTVAPGEPGQCRVAGFFAPRSDTPAAANVAPALPTETVVLNDPPGA